MALSPRGPRRKMPTLPVSTCVLLLLAPLLLVSFNFPKEISCLIQWEPVLGDSGWTYILLPKRKTERKHKHVHKQDCWVPGLGWKCLLVRPGFAAAGLRPVSRNLWITAGLQAPPPGPGCFQPFLIKALLSPGSPNWKQRWLPNVNPKSSKAGQDVPHWVFTFIG